MKTQMKFRTTAAYVSGAICGSMWWPATPGANLINKDLRGYFGIWQKGDSFEDALNSLLMRDGGDFQNALFTADTVIRIERRANDGPCKYRVHVKEIPLLDFLPSLCNEELYTGDFISD